MRILGNDMAVPARVPFGRIQSFAPAAREQGNEFVLPWTLENSQRLTDLRVPCISPMAAHYDFPGKHEPRDFQIQGADFLARNRRAYMLMDPGLGKTLTAAWAFDYLLQEGVIRKVLIVPPKSILYTSWEQDLRQNLFHLPVTVLDGGTNKQRQEKIGAATPVHILNHDGPHHVMAALLKANYDLIVLDESTAMGDDASQRSRALQRLVGPDTWLWQMTGTPAAQSPMPAHGQIKLMGNVDATGRPVDTRAVRGGPFMTRKRWRDLTMQPVYGEGIATSYEAKKNANEVIFRYMQPAFRRSKSQVLKELPPVTFQRREVDLPSATLKALKNLQANFKHEAEDGAVVSAVNAAVKMSKIVQILCGCAYAEELEAGQDEGQARPMMQFDVRPKQRELEALLDSTRERAIIYCPFLSTVEDVAAFCRSTGRNIATLTGAVKPKVMSEILRVFQDPLASDRPDAIVAIPQKMSHGVTATAADLTVWYGPIVRVETYLQANNRMDRIGQTKPMRIVSLTSHSYEARLYDRLEKRVLTQNELLSLYEAFVTGSL